MEPRVRRRGSIGAALHTAGINRQPGDPLRHVVVQLAREPGTLRLVGLDQKPAQVMQGRLGLPARSDIDEAPADQSAAARRQPDQSHLAIQPLAEGVADRPFEHDGFAAQGPFAVRTHGPRNRLPIRLLRGIEPLWTGRQQFFAAAPKSRSAWALASTNRPCSTS